MKLLDHHISSYKQRLVQGVAKEWQVRQSDEEFMVRKKDKDADGNVAEWSGKGAPKIRIFAHKLHLFQLVAWRPLPNFILIFIRSKSLYFSPQLPHL